MDLDFSFALVSSLTPRRKAEKSSTTDVLKKTNSLKTKPTLPIEFQKLEETSHQKTEEKENLIPNKRLMNKNDVLKSTKSIWKSDATKKSHKRDSNDAHDFSINMENIAIRRRRTQRKKNTEISPLLFDISDEKPVEKSCLSNERLSRCASDTINISSDIEDKNNKTELSDCERNNIKGNSPRQSRASDTSVRSSLEIIESSCSEVKGNSPNICRGLRSHSLKKRNVKTHPEKTPCISESSLSTAYDSDSFQATRRRGTKVLLETPDTDSSVKSPSEKRKSSILSSVLEENKLYSLRSCDKESPKKHGKRKSSELSGSPHENNKRFSIKDVESPDNGRPKRKSSLVSLKSEKNKPTDEFYSCIPDNAEKYAKPKVADTLCKSPNNLSNAHNEIQLETRLKKKLRTSNDSTILDMFKLESTIKDQSLVNDVKNEVTKTKFGSTSLSNKNPKKGDNTDSMVKKPAVEKKSTKEKEMANKKNVVSQTTDSKSKKHPSIQKSPKVSSEFHCSPKSPKVSTLVLPSEIIPKFEHINQWLQDTQEKSGSLRTDVEITSGISNKDIMPTKNTYKVSLSPRIKKRKDKAKSSLEEEQKLFEELYGADYGKRLSDDIDEVSSSASCQDSVEFSENVLDKLYGRVWQEKTAGTQSEPRRTRKKNVKNKTLTEKKKRRTSIYEVFSSSSSEDRFEEFLENVQRGKVESTKRRSNRPATPEFINDSDSEDHGSLVFYQNIMSSAVKDQVNSIKIEEAGQDTHKVNRRRLSFGSSKDDVCSESGKSDTKKTAKSKISPNEGKIKTKKSRAKKKADKHNDEKSEDGIDVFSLVTPLRIKGKKKTRTALNEKVQVPTMPDVPRSVGKSKTPKTSTRERDQSNSEERLRTQYLGQNDFKIPKSATKMFKTPSKSIKPDVPSSPALSFLSSLSEMTAGLPCHPDALIYKNNFKAKREELTKRLFTLYNKEVFDNQLPEDMLIQWNSRMTSTSGYCYNKRIYRNNEVLRSSRIVLSTKILDRADRLRDTLIHELCHAATWIVHATSDGHGPIWRSWADKANRRFPELPVIKRCHDYAISTKFTYKCMSCGYSIGRHTKSLDTERKRCGYCFGKFQVFVTAKMSSGSVTSGSDSVKTPRNPTGFALFVKENYALVKKENNVPHAQVMKLLSQKFAEVKISKHNKEEPIIIE